MYVPSLDGNIITAEDLEAYTVKVREPVKSVLKNGNFTIISPPPPSGGVVIQYLLQILDGKSIQLFLSTLCGNPNPKLCYVGR